MVIVKLAKFNIGQSVRHSKYDFGGVVVDADTVFGETEEWLAAIPENIRPERDQPFYRVRVDYDGVEAIAYVSEQNLMADETGIYTPSAVAAQDNLGLPATQSGMVH